MNYIPEIAKMIGVEIGEEFYVAPYYNIPYVFYEDGLYSANGKILSNDILFRILNGTQINKNTFWKPSIGRPYWVVHPDGYVYNMVYSGCHEDKAYFKLGNCYPNKESAEKDLTKWVKFYDSNITINVELTEDGFIFEKNKF